MLKLVRFYVQLIKTPQTSLLILTAFAGYRSATNNLQFNMIAFAMFGLLLAVSGTTALNMVFDRDIDSIMQRTKNRPIPVGKLTPKAALIFGVFLIISGLFINYFISFPFANVVLAGVFFDLIIYTVWLKRRSPLSILFGGIAGGMPILAGRVLAIGYIDWVGAVLTLSILLWIPTHILSLAMNHAEDYKLAGVPTFPNVFGFKSARNLIAISNIVAAGLMLIAFYLLNVPQPGMYILRISIIILLIFSIKMVASPSQKSNLAMFRYASIYMGVAMLILIF